MCIFAWLAYWIMTNHGDSCGIIKQLCISFETSASTSKFILFPLFPPIHILGFFMRILCFRFTTAFVELFFSASTYYFSYTIDLGVKGDFHSLPLLKIETRNAKNRSVKNSISVNSILGYIPILISP